MIQIGVRIWTQEYNYFKDSSLGDRRSGQKEMPSKYGEKLWKHMCVIAGEGLPSVIVILLIISSVYRGTAALVSCEASYHELSVAH